MRLRAFTANQPIQTGVPMIDRSNRKAREAILPALRAADKDADARHVLSPAALNRVSLAAPMAPSIRRLPKVYC